MEEAWEIISYIYVHDSWKTPSVTQIYGILNGNQFVFVD
jgi:hypothetical protein